VLLATGTPGGDALTAEVTLAETELIPRNVLALGLRATIPYARVAGRQNPKRAAVVYECPLPSATRATIVAANPEEAGS